MNCKNWLFISIVVIFFGFIALYQSQIAQARRDLFLIDQCANERTVSIEFSDGSRTHCLSKEPREQMPKAEQELGA